MLNQSIIYLSTYLSGIFNNCQRLQETKRHSSLFLHWKLNSVALVRERTVPTEQPPPVGEVSANFCG
jgi:hypothetical protein